MKTAYTREEVINILVSVFMFAGANNNQGVQDIKGNTYGEMADTVLDANDSIEGTGKSIISVVSKFRK